MAWWLLGDAAILGDMIDEGAMDSDTTEPSSSPAIAAEFQKWFHIGPDSESLVFIELICSMVAYVRFKTSTTPTISLSSSTTGKFK
jgi:hypothetical protein